MRVLLDSNILVYSVDQTDSEKNTRAVKIIQDAMRRPREYGVSLQALTEFANVALKKLDMSGEAVLSFLSAFKSLTGLLPDRPLVMRGVELKVLYGIQFYDAMMVAAAERFGADEIWSEDLNPGQCYGNVRAVNPFE